MAAPPSGEQFEIRSGESRATIVEVGGGVRRFETAERPVLEEYPVDRISDGAHGAPLAPWPNRLADGRYRFTAANVGQAACPYGFGQHPYLSPGSGLIDDCILGFAGTTRIDTDKERQLPTGTEPAAGTRFDFTEPKRLGELEIDFAFIDLIRDPAGRAWTSLKGPDGAFAEIWVDETFPYLEIYTGDTLAPDRARRGLGTEPMTCAPNAFNSGDDLLRLEPGESFTCRWGARLR